MADYTLTGTVVTGSNTSNESNYSAQKQYTFEKGKKYILQIVAGNSWDGGTFTYSIGSTNTNGWTLLHHKINGVSRSKSGCTIYLIEPTETYTATVTASGKAKAYYMDVIVHFTLIELM